MKAGKTQGSKITSRVVDPGVADSYAARAEQLQSEVEEVLEEEKTEKQLSQAEMQVTKGENLMKHQSEILARPKRTWFETEKQKQDARSKGAVELNGPGSTKEKVKLSNKDKKRMDDSRARKEGGNAGMGWKKGKAEREAPPAKQKQDKGKNAKKAQKKGKK